MVVQDVVIGEVLTEYVRQLTGRPLIVVVLSPSPEAVVRREAARSKVAYRDSFDDVHALDRALREETPRLGMWLDSSNLSPAETVDAIVARALAEGLIP